VTEGCLVSHERGGGEIVHPCFQPLQFQINRIGTPIEDRMAGFPDDSSDSLVT